MHPPPAMPGPDAGPSASRCEPRGSGGRGSPAAAEAPAAAKLDRSCCRVPGCPRELLPGFLTRCRCCEFHSREASVELEGAPCRFCQQCGFFHPLEDFDDLRRSCRKSLERHRMCRKLRREKALKAAAATGAAEGEAAAEGVAEGAGEGACELPPAQPTLAPPAPHTNKQADAAQPPKKLPKTGRCPSGRPWKLRWSCCGPPL
jgi:hypothetical protein